MWQHWNKEALHEDDGNQQGIIKAEVIQQLQTIYAKGPSALGSSANTLLKRYVNDLLQLYMVYKQQRVDIANIAQEWANRQ